MHNWNYLSQENLTLQVCNLPHIYSYSCTTRLRTLQCIAGWIPTILDSFYQHHKHIHPYIRLEGRDGGEPQSDRLQWSLAIFKVKMPTRRPHCTQTATIIAKNMVYCTYHQPVRWWFPVRCLPTQANWWHLMNIQAIVNKSLRNRSQQNQICPLLAEVTSN